MTISIDDLVRQVKEVNKIEDVIGETSGFSVIGHGRNWTTREHDSLVIDTHNQSYWWNSTGEHGDVIEWLCKRQGVDFKAAMEKLCKRGGLAAPDWRQQDPAQRMAARHREDVLTVAMDLFHQWLLRDAAASEYCHGRGWTDETIKRGLLGYTGNKENLDQYYKEMIDAMGYAGIDIFSPAAVAVVGFKGNVNQWCTEHGLIPDKRWLENGRIWGVIGWDRLVYPHFFGGRAVYFSLRGIHEKEHFNPPVELMGERQVMANGRWSSSVPMVVVVEGQADAITLDQWDIPAVALNGVAADERIARMLGATKENKRAIFYLGLDSDKAGKLNSSKIATVLGPMTRIVAWNGIAGITKYHDQDGNEHEVKDANDLLRGYLESGLESSDFMHELATSINLSITFVERITDWAGRQEGAERDYAIQAALKVIVEMSEVERAQYQKSLAKSLQVDQRELSRMVKTIQDQAKKKDDSGDTVQYILDGFIGGYVIEYLYDRTKHTSKFAMRDPNGNIKSCDSVSIDGIKYMPLPPDEIFRDRGVFLPSELGELKTAGELAGLIELYINSVYILPNELTGKILSYWVLITWLFDCFNAIPYLRAMGASGAGKSELLYRVGIVSYRLLMAGGADSTSSLFRSIEQFHPTLLFDEGDIDKSDASNEKVKLLNFGSMKNHPIWRTEEVIDADGKKTYVSRPYQTYCPKMIGMRRDFRDDAVGNRAITFKIQERSMRELMARNIDLEITEEIHQRALAIRNKLIHWRLKNWEPEITINKEFYEMDISPRLNQITGALMMVAKDDERLRNEIKGFMRDYYFEMAQNRNQTIIARIIEAILKIYQYPDLHKKMVKKDPDGKEKILVGDATKIADQLMDSMYAVDDDKPSTNDDQDSSKGHLHPHKIGRIIENDLLLKKAKRSHDGIAFYYDHDRIMELARQYGIDPADFGPLPEKPKGVQPELPQ